MYTNYKTNSILSSLINVNAVRRLPIVIGLERVSNVYLRIPAYSNHADNVCTGKRANTVISNQCTVYKQSLVFHCYNCI